MAFIRVPDNLNALSGDRKVIEVEGKTVKEALDGLEEQLPGIKERITNNGEIKHFINIFVDGEDIRFEQGLNTEIKADSEISILPAVAGGK